MTEASNDQRLRGAYAICGVGETPYRRGSGQTTRSLASQAVANALADAGLNASDVDGMLSFSGNDSTLCPEVANDVGVRPDFYLDVKGGGSSPEALVGVAMGVIEAGMCTTVVIYRSLNGFTQHRMGGSGARSATPIVGDELHRRPYGWYSAAEMYAPAFLRHMYEYGTTPEQVAEIKAVQSRHASNNPKALYRRRVTVDDVLDSRMICTPLHLLDCCVETDNAACIIVTSTERARDLRRRPVTVLAAAGRVSKPRPDIFLHYQHGPITSTAGQRAAESLWRRAGVGPRDIDVTGAYDAFTFTVLLQLEDYGFCPKGDGGAYASSGAIELGGERPNNTSGGHLCEGYAQGMNLIIENVRQLRGEADDGCDGAGQGRHTFDYSEGRCRQVPGAELAANLGWAHPGTGSALVLARDG